MKCSLSILSISSEFFKTKFCSLLLNILVPSWVDACLNLVKLFLCLIIQNVIKCHAYSAFFPRIKKCCLLVLGPIITNSFKITCACFSLIWLAQCILVFYSILCLAKWEKKIQHRSLMKSVCYFLDNYHTHNPIKSMNIYLLNIYSSSVLGHCRGATGNSKNE